MASKKEVLTVAKLEELGRISEICDRRVIIKLGALISTRKGKKPKVLSEMKITDDYVPYVNIDLMTGGNKSQIQYANKKENTVICNPNDILMVWDGARSGYIGIGSSGIVGSTLSKISIPMINNKYLYYFLKSKYDYLNKNTRGTGIPHVNPEILGDIDFPLYSLEEQKRISEKVERFVNKIEEAKKLIEEAKETFELRRAAILDKAFLGEYTSNLHFNYSKVVINKSKSSIKDDGKAEEFKKQLGTLIPGHWEMHSLTDILEQEREICYGIVQTGEATENGVPTIRAGDLKEEVVDVKNLKKVDPDIENKYPRSRLKGNEVLISIRGSIGYIGFTTEKMVGLNVSREVAIIPINETVCKEYLKYYLQSPLIQGFFKKIKKGVAQSGINLNQLRALTVAIPSLDEQKYIVKKIDFLFEKENGALKELKKIESLIQKLDESILFYAFQGKLGTNEPSEETSIELLKEILQEQVK